MDERQISLQITPYEQKSSSVSVYASTAGMACDQTWPIAVREIQNGEVKELKENECPVRYLDNYIIPVYIGKKC